VLHNSAEIVDHGHISAKNALIKSMSYNAVDGRFLNHNLDYSKASKDGPEIAYPYSRLN